jgi:hypothetical protein
MKALLTSAILLIGSVAFAAAPESIKVETSYTINRVTYKVDGTALLHKETDKKVDYRGVATVENGAIPEDLRRRDIQLVVKKKRKKDLYIGNLYIAGTLELVVNFESPTLVPAANEVIKGEFTASDYLPGGIDDIDIWFPVASHATDLTIRY